jgi:hypothetical protein
MARSVNCLSPKQQEPIKLLHTLPRYILTGTMTVTIAESTPFSIVCTYLYVCRHNAYLTPSLRYRM